LKKIFPALYSRALDPAGPKLSHWSDTGWNIKVLYEHEEQLDNMDELNQLYV